MVTMPPTSVKGRLNSKQTVLGSVNVNMSAAYTGTQVAVGDWIFLMMGSAGGESTAQIPQLTADYVEVFSFRAMGKPDTYFSGTTCFGIWAKKRLVGETNYSIAVDDSGTRTNGVTVDVVWFDGTNVPDPSTWVVGPSQSRHASGGTFTDVAPSVTTTIDNSVVYAFFTERTSATDTDAGHTISGTGWTKTTPTFLEGTYSASTTFDIAHKPLVVAGVSGDVSRTTTTTQTINGSAFQLIWPPIADPAPPALTGHLWDGSAVVNGTWFVSDGNGASVATSWAGAIPPGYSSISNMLSQFFYIAHRGGSRNWPEGSLQGYTQSALRGYGALEVSLARTSDGVWFALHDSYLDRTSLGNAGGTTLRASTMTWAQVQAYDLLPASGSPVDSLHKPYMRLEEVLNAYASSHVIFIDPKSAESFRDELIVILKSYANWQDKFVAKTVPLNSTSAWLASARAAGFATNAMFYQTDTAPNYAQADILGMDYTASQSTWDTIKAVGKPLLAHVCPDLAAINTGIAKGAVGAIVSGPNQARLVTIP